MYLRSSLLLVFTNLLLAAPQGWVPYTAHFKDTNTYVDKGGKEQVQTLTGAEKRSADGSLLRTIVGDNETPVRGFLWKASDGQTYGIDYLGKRLFKTRIQVRQHSVVPPDTPIGSENIAGLTCTGYPMRDSKTHELSGSMWVDQANDIVCRMEVHGKGFTRIKELTALTFETPDQQLFVVPSSMTVIEQPKIITQ